MHLSTARSWRGGENQILLLCQGLLARGHQALIVAPVDAPLLSRAAEHQIPTHPLTVHSELDLLAVWRLRRLLKSAQPDLLHLHDGHGVLPGKWAAKPLRRTGLKVLAHRRTVFPLRSPRKYDSAIDSVICISQAVQQTVVSAGLPAEKTRVVYSGMPEGEALPVTHPLGQQLRQRLGIAPQTFVVGHAAALSSEKRQADLIRSFGQAARTLPCGASLLLAGSGPLEEALKRLAQQFVPSCASIHFLGFQKELRPLLAASNAVVYCSESEGLCTALIEAQLAGKPALITRAGGMPEAIAEGQTGRCVEIGSIDAMAQILQEWAENPAQCQQMGLAARERALGLFGSKAMVEGLLAAYQDCYRSTKDDLRSTNSSQTKK